MEGTEDLEQTPTWAVSIFCLFFFILSFAIDAGLHHLAKLLRKRKRKSLDKALVKIKTEMMNFGFISLLLAILEVPISKICITEAAAISFLPCKDAADSVPPNFSSAKQVPGSNSSETFSNQITADNYCQAKGMVSLVSREAILQLNVFISVLAVFHVLYCILTMCLGVAKMRKWEAWEEETQTLQYQIAYDPKRFQLSRQTSFGRRHLKLWSDHPLLLWPVCFARQFSSSVSKADYFALRNGFIMVNVAEGSNFNFKKFLSRAFDDDFEQVIGIRYTSLPTYNKVVERVVRGLENWQKNARRSLSKNRFNSSRHLSNSSQFNIPETSISNTQSKHLPEHDDLPPLAVISPSSHSPGKAEEEVQHDQTPNPAITSLSTQEIMKEEANRTIITTGTYDGEISFGSSWKAQESSRGISEITSITEEDASDTLTVFNHQDID